MAIIKACKVGGSVKNTGKECDISMGPTAMLLPVPASLTFTLAEIQDIISWITPLLHAALGLRVYPLFGQKAPINTITNNAESDVTVTLDDGTLVFVRYGIYNRTYETISGGLCYARSLMSFLKSGMNVIEIDKQGKMLIAKTGTKNGGGEDLYRGMIPNFMYAPSPILADFKNTYKNRFAYSFDPEEMVNNGEIFDGATPLLNIMGLIDAVLTPGLTTQTTTNIFIGVETECAEADLVALFGTPLAHVGNFTVKNKATGAAVSVTAGAVVGGEVRLTGTYVSGQTYTVTAAAPSVWLSNAVDGYDGSASSVDILIP